MALIPPFFLDTVVAIGTYSNDKKNWIGTGFLVGYLVSPINAPEKIYKTFLVTNKHVLNDLSLIILRFNPQNDQPATDFPVPLIDGGKGEKKWFGHPDPAIDIAIIGIDGNFLRNQGMKFAFFTSESHILGTNEMQIQGTSEGDNVYVLGFPMGIVASDRQNVIVRGGVISRIKDLYENRSKDFVVDAFVFPGNSGGPVVSRPELIAIQGTNNIPNAHLIGIVKAYLPYEDIAVSQQTGRPKVIFEQNSGLSLVIPANYIIETIQNYLSSQQLDENEETKKQMELGTN